MRSFKLTSCMKILDKKNSLFVDIHVTVTLLLSPLF